MKSKLFRSLLISSIVTVLFIFAFRTIEKYRFEADKLGGLRLLSNLEWSWYDARFRFKKPESSQTVMVAKIDDRSLARFGRWPWSRALYPKILDSLYGMGAKTVSFDAVFSEPEFKKSTIASSIKDPRKGNKALQEELKLDDQQIAGISEGLERYGEDQFALGLSAYSQSTLGYLWLDAIECKIYDPDAPEGAKLSHEKLSVEEAQQRGYMHVEELTDHLSNLTEQAILVPADNLKTAYFESYPCPISNRGSLSKSARYQGYFIAPSESDGVFRRIKLVLPLRMKAIPESARGFLPEEWNKNLVFFPSLSLQSLISSMNPKADLRHPAPKPEVVLGKNDSGELIIKSIKVIGENSKSIEIPTLPDGSVMINFLGSQEIRSDGIAPSLGEFSLSELPFAEDKVQRIPGEFGDADYKKAYAIQNEIIRPLESKSIFIGPTALGVFDLRPNPVQEGAAGVFLHANLLSRLLDFAKTGVNRISVTFVPFAWVCALFIGLVLAYTLLMYRATAAKGGLLSISLMGLLIVIDRGLFIYQLQVLPMMTMMIGFISVSAALLTYKYFTEERERAFVKGAFSKFVSPDLIKQIEADPSKLNLGGTKKELTVLFSDIRGFTTISERMKADDLAKFMNDYLSPMTEIVLENRGTIDKYMGDAIMAIFGAPVEYANHAEKAVDTALKMMEKLEELKMAWKAQGLPPIDIGIGINTGEMSVGNMGSKRIMAYTVMGDSVNLGSRLEGINKKYHTHIIISEYTRAVISADYIVREVDRVRVKGKNLPVTIYEVVAKGSVDASKRMLIEKFTEALHLYYKQDFVKAKEIFQLLSGVDDCSADYVGRCESMIANTPPVEWDGSSTMDSK